MASQPVNHATERGRVLIVDDDEAIARAWARILRLDGWQIAHAGTLLEARGVMDSRPGQHVVFLDVTLPDGSGLTLLDDLNALSPRPSIVVVTARSDAGLAVDMLGRVDAIVPKPVAGIQLMAIARRTTAERTRAHVVAFAHAYRLSPRESGLLQLAACGATDQACAERLNLSLSTIKTYWRRLYAKTKCYSQRAVFVALWRDAHRRARGAIHHG
jgi:DNA-binding NarL/FixJ family response regulator